MTGAGMSRQNMSERADAAMTGRVFHKVRALLLSSLLLLLACSAGLAVEDLYSFTRMGFGARALGMGGAHAAVTDDAFATFWNPAGLGFAQGHQVGAMYANVFNFNTAFNEISYLVPVNDHSMSAFDLKMLRTGSIPITRLDGNFRPIIYGYDEDNATELKFSYGYRFSPGFSSGFNLKYIHEKAATITGKGWGLDWGFQYRPSDSIWLGASVVDITGTDVKWGTGEIDTLPLMVRAGVLGRFLDGKVNLAMDVDAVGSESLKWHVGSEYWFNSVLAMRAGSDERQFTFGMTYQQPRWSFEYAFMNHRMEDIHRFSVNLFLDEINRKVIEDRRKKKKVDQILDFYSRQPQDFKKQELDRLLKVQKKKEAKLFKPAASAQADGGAKPADEAVPVRTDGVTPPAKASEIFFDEDIPAPPHRFDGRRKVAVMRKTSFGEPTFETDRPVTSEIRTFKPGSDGKLAAETVRDGIPPGAGDGKLVGAAAVAEAMAGTESAIRNVPESAIRRIPGTEKEIERRRRVRVTPEKLKEILAADDSILAEKTAMATKDLRELKDAVTLYNGREDGYATNIYQLVGKQIKKAPLDPWGTDYKIFPMKGIIKSAGPDRQFNTDDDLYVSYIE